MCLGGRGGGQGRDGHEAASAEVVIPLLGERSNLDPVDLEGHLHLVVVAAAGAGTKLEAEGVVGRGQRTEGAGHGLRRDEALVDLLAVRVTHEERVAD